MCALSRVEGMRDVMPGKRPVDPLHGVTLKMIVTRLVEHFGWEQLGRIIEIRCFTHDPSIPSSLKFLRRTPWARDRVEELYLRSIVLEDRESRGDEHE
jgi:uncharacterized protein (DUF2132 family)